MKSHFLSRVGLNKQPGRTTFGPSDRNVVGRDGFRE